MKFDKGISCVFALASMRIKRQSIRKKHWKPTTGKRRLILAVGLFILMGGFFLGSSVYAQLTSLTPEEMIQYSPMWKGERFADGRPQVADRIIERLKYCSVTEAWQILYGMNDGPGRFGSYINQYAEDWVRMHDDVTICGRALTAHFMPARPDVNLAIEQQGIKDNRSRGGQYTWGIDQLQKGDVYVVNVCEGILDASHVGDNLGTAIFSRSNNGAIIRGTVRDLEGNVKMEGFNLFVRDFRPQWNMNNMMVGINCPIQIGYVTVMPGDIVLAKRMGVVFIPPHLAERVADISEETRLRDTFAHMGVREGRFSAREADGAFTDAMNKEFTQWLRDHINDMGKFFDDPREAPSPAFIQNFIKKREE
jgi:regulator of RNase E activity RraA